MRRMLQLAIKRLRATAPVRVCVIQPTAAPTGSARMQMAAHGNDANYDPPNADDDASSFHPT